MQPRHAMKQRTRAFRGMLQGQNVGIGGGRGDTDHPLAPQRQRQRQLMARQRMPPHAQQAARASPRVLRRVYQGQNGNAHNLLRMNPWADTEQ